MAKKKKTSSKRKSKSKPRTKRTIKKNKVIKHSAHSIKQKATIKDKGPNFMIQLGDSNMLRKDLLESLREVIIFMQGYETFKKIQEEKMFTFTNLKNDLKELNLLVHQLEKYLPKGKLKELAPRPILVSKSVPPKKEFSSENERVNINPAKKIAPALLNNERYVEQKESELDNLEHQLKDIEKQLQNMN